MGDGAFLSERWMEELGRRLRDAVPADAAPLRLGVIVTSAPGEVRYTLRLGGGTPAELVAGSVEDAEVVIVETFEDARALAEGSVTAAELLEGGRIKVRGDANRLVAAAETLGAAGSALPEALGKEAPAD